jgi:hypothetical protein
MSESLLLSERMIRLALPANFDPIVPVATVGFAVAGLDIFSQRNAARRFRPAIHTFTATATPPTTPAIEAKNIVPKR